MFGGRMKEKPTLYKTVGIIAAMQMEIDGIRKKLQNASVETISGVEYVRGTLHGKTVIAAKCGIGKVFAAMCAQTMILRYAPDCIIHTGVAGGLTETLQVLDLVIATHVVQYDMDTSAVGDPVGMISGINVVEFSCDRRIIDVLCSSAEQLQRPFTKGIVATGDTFVCTAEQRRRIREQFHADACEMEGGAVGQVCYVNQVPFGILRSISDSAGETSGMDYAAFAAAAADTAVAAVEHTLQVL